MAGSRYSNGVGIEYDPDVAGKLLEEREVRFVIDLNYGSYRVLGLGTGPNI